jgi:tellurite resistance protein
MTVDLKLPIVPASFFGIVLGLAGMGNAWRAAHNAYATPAVVGEALLAVAALVWVVVLVLFILKWVVAREHALEEARHPVQCCFIGLAGVATMLIGIATVPYSRSFAAILVASGAAFALAFALWRTGLLWEGGREPAATTAVLYLPTVAAGFIMATSVSALGYPQWAQLAFGAAFFSWLAIESVLLHRLYTVSSLPAALRPTLGIQLAPPAVGAVAYLSVNGTNPDLGAYALVGYGLLQALLLLRLLPWIMEQPFSASYWSFTFGVSAMATAPLRMVAHGDGGPLSVLAPYLFAAANIIIGIISLATLRLMVRGRVLAPVVPAPSRATR